MSSFNNTQNPLLVTIEGNIGAGKSSIIAKMKERYADRSDIVFVQEPVDIWDGICDENGTKMLNLFYQNPKEHAFAFQQMAYITRISRLRRTIAENPQCKVLICERSLDADRNIFAKMLFDDGIISKVCFQIYSLIYDEFTGGFPIDRCVYIDADPEICYERITKRARSGESGIALEYLTKCKKYHDDWLLQSSIETPILGERQSEERAQAAEDSLEKMNLHKILHLKTNQNATYQDGDADDCGNKWIQQIMDFIKC
jgi:deoxyadenosine/deoxycytidine kinase